MEKRRLDEEVDELESLKWNESDFILGAVWVRPLGRDRFYVRSRGWVRFLTRERRDDTIRHG